MTVGDIPLTKRAEKILKMAYMEADKFKSAVTGTEHLLLALVREQEGVAAQVLFSFDVTYDLIREEPEFIELLARLGVTAGAAAGGDGQPPRKVDISGLK